MKELAKIIADFQTSLATTIAIGGVSGTLVSNTDDDGGTLPNGRYFFTIDGGNAFKEHISCTLTGKEMTDIYSVSRQGVETSGAVKSHRVGATIIITDFAHIKKLNDLLDGTTGLDSDNPLKYDADPSITNDAELATKKYMDALANAGNPDASESAKGIAKLSVAPASPTDPIAVGTNDGRIPTADQKAALTGTGVPSSSNKFVTANDTNLTNNVKTTGDQTVGGVKTFSSLPVLPATTPTSSNQAVSKKYIDDLLTFTTGSVTDGSITLNYSKIGRTFFGFYCYTFNGVSYDYLPLYPDSVTATRFCSLMSKTYSAFYPATKTLIGVNDRADGAVCLKWSGSAWVQSQTGSGGVDRSNYLDVIVISD